MKKIIAISNQKGGVGKTTTCTNLSACLGVLGSKVLVVDFDPQGNATGGLGIKPSAIGSGIYNALMGNETMHRIILKTEYKNLFIAPTDVNLSGATIELPEIEDCNYVLKNLLASVKSEYDFIFIDCPPSLGLLTVNSLTAADKILIPLQCEYYAMEGMSQLLHTVEQIKENLNPELSIGGILATMYDSRNNISKLVLNELKTHFKEFVFDTIIHRNVKLSEAPSFGQPVWYYDAKSKGSETYMQLASEFRKKN